MEVGYITDLNFGDIRGRRTSVEKNLKTIDGYTPKNKKCFIYPYNYMVLTNNSGGNTIIKYELFDTDNPTDPANFVHFEVVGSNPTLYVVPFGYKGQDLNYECSVTYANFPQLPWNYDYFKNWQALNSNTLATDFISSGFNLTTAAATGNIGSVINGIGSIANKVAGMTDKSKIPEETRGHIQGNALIYSGGAGCFVRCECVKAEYINIIDDYFTRYGYLVNSVRKPLLRNRKNFDYIETDGMNLSGGVPSDDLTELCQIFDNGLTIWHNPETFGDYDVDNSPIGK